MLVLREMLEELASAEIIALVQLQNEYGFSALHYASAENHPAIIVCLLEKLSPEEKYSIMKIKQEGLTCLHHAELQHSTEAINSLLQQLDAGRRFNLLQEKSQHGKTVLHLVAEDGNCSSVSVILDQLRGSEILCLMNSEDEHHETPLDVAVRKNEWGTVHLLEQYRSLAVQSLDARALPGKNTEQLFELV